ncbi:methyltransferase domain-containing protein [Thermomonospora cellulosilytica]|uniref:Protein-L-isoaspartate O-methyltransferase n=1 Tax=Thermomonospora cellulosilytica TaxID=1411118 RepID=A0A7W3R6V7_9ACTN|nr:methyltransferase domain-containing protein [Thermomonospora cellulosilytica]MBA9001725.1 protein-L-isoaspartate(D-aspartate) O-methyltransferase [Thermomonospora cellulosilytica]
MKSAREALRAVPRDLFIPDVIWVDGEDGYMRPLSRSAEPDRWATLVHSDESVIVQVDDGAKDRGFWSTSSSSGPPIMAKMLDAMRLEEGMRVLEIGTGTGYNAAVLAHLIGAENVTTIEVDAALAEQARQSLRKAGYPVQVVTGDGEEGYPPNAPYDRIVATAAAHTVPYAWVEQTRPGGLILVPWAATFHPDCPLAVLTVREDGTGTAEGRFAGPSWFMPLRGQRQSYAVAREAKERWEKAGRPDSTRFGVTVTPQGQRVWLDDPGNVI